MVKPLPKKDKSTSPVPSGHKNSFDNIIPKKKPSKSVNDKSSRSGDGCMKTRKEIWMDKCGAKRLMDSNPGYYQSLLDNFLEYPNPSFHQIELDLRRTFSDMKEHNHPEREQQMRNILRAYVKRNPSIGYCQGVNFITAILLQHLNEEEAFWVLCQIIEYMLPLDYYTIMTGVIIDQRWLELLVKDRIPAITKHLRKVEYDCQANLFQWFVCLFANTLPFDVVANIWDQFFSKGIIALFQYALGIFEIMKKPILKTKDMGELFENFRNFPATIKWKDLNAAAKKHKITWETIKNKRCYLRPIVYEEFEEQHRKKSTDVNMRSSIGAIKVKFLNKFHLFNGIMKERGHGEIRGSIMDNFEEEVVNAHDCNPDWPICLYDFLYKDKTTSHFAYRSEKIDIVDDYFGDGTGEQVQAQTNSELSFQHANTSYEDLLIERNAHICGFDNLESKFKALFNNQINEFFLSVIHLSADDPFDELIDNHEKIRGFIEICSELVERHNIM